MEQWIKKLSNNQSNKTRKIRAPKFGDVFGKSQQFENKHGRNEVNIRRRIIKKKESKFVHYSTESYETDILHQGSSNVQYCNTLNIELITKLTRPQNNRVNVKSISREQVYW